MKRAFKYIIHFYRRFDISPVSPGGFSKELIVLFWGLNAVFFLANSVTSEYGYENIPGKGISCTLIKKVSSKDYYTEHTEIIDNRDFIVISSYDFKLPEFDVTKLIRDRSPPV